MSGKLDEPQKAQVLRWSEEGWTSEQIARVLFPITGVSLHPANIRKFIAKHRAAQSVLPDNPLAEFALDTKKAQLAAILSEMELPPPLFVKTAKDGHRVVVISDMQIPYHDPKIIGSPHKKMALIERFIREYQPDTIVIDGDGIDCYSLSTFDKNPHRIFKTKDELAMAGNMLDMFHKLCPNAVIIWLDGNHEYRLWRTYMELCAKDVKVLEVLGAAGITTLDTSNLLHLADRGVQYQPYSGHLNFLSFIITHGDIVRSNSSYTARGMYEKWHSSGASGHTHRLGCYHFTDGTGRTHAWYELGSLCLNTLEYVSNPNWQQGFGYGQVLRNKLHFLMAPIFDNAIVVPGVGTFEGN